MTTRTTAPTVEHENMTVRAPTHVFALMRAVAATHGRPLAQDMRNAMEIYGVMAALADLQRPEERERLGEQWESTVEQVKRDLADLTADAFDRPAPLVEALPPTRLN